MKKTFLAVSSYVNLNSLFLFSNMASVCLSTTGKNRKRALTKTVFPELFYGSLQFSAFSEGKRVS